ncbi:MAG: hypothetical protein VX899_04210 [Myxococcota bacterium]|nr:hypothetical protein [Myxococcota bacterium]
MSDFWKRISDNMVGFSDFGYCHYPQANWEAVLVRTSADELVDRTISEHGGHLVQESWANYPPSSYHRILFLQLKGSAWTQVIPDSLFGRINSRVFGVDWPVVEGLESFCVSAGDTAGHSFGYLHAHGDQVVERYLSMEEGGDNEVEWESLGGLPAPKGSAGDVVLHKAQELRAVVLWLPFGSFVDKNGVYCLPARLFHFGRLSRLGPAPDDVYDRILGIAVPKKGRLHRHSSVHRESGSR